MERQRELLGSSAGGFKAEFDEAAQGFVAVREPRHVPEIFDFLVGRFRHQQGNPNFKRLIHGVLWLQIGFDTTHSATIGMMEQA